LLIISLKLIVTYAMELALLARYYSTNCRFNVCTETSGLPRRKATANEWGRAVIQLINWQLLQSLRCVYRPESCDVIIYLSRTLR